MSRIFALAKGLPLVLLLALGACEHPAIFSSESIEPSTNWDENFQQNVIIDLHITGGFAGVDQRLQIASTGMVIYRDGHAIFRDMLTADELANLKALFYENDFFNLNSDYRSNWVDVFYYDLLYREGNLEKRVSADAPAAPAGMKAILEALSAVIQSASRQLAFRFRVVPPDTLRPGKTVELIFIVQNISRAPLTLRFRSGQQYDFYAVRPVAADFMLQAFSRPLWKWSNGMSFTQALVNRTLQPGEALSFRSEWDGTDNAGNRLSGEVWLAAELVSVPGGIAKPWKIVVQAE